MSNQIKADEEVWEVLSFASGYAVSNFGRVKSLARTIIRKDGKPYPVKGCILKQRTYDYASVDIKVGSPVSVHRLMASAFLGLDYEDKLSIVNHKDGDRLNNILENLEICDHSYNTKDGFVRGRVIHNKGKCCLSEEQKRDVKKLYTGGIFQKDIAKLFNVSQATISGVVNDITN